MPFSSLVFDGRVETLIRTSEHQRYLDIGPGAGKYGKLIRLWRPTAHVTAVDIDPTYIDTYGLHAIYDEIHVMPVQEFTAQRPDYTVDCAILGDCIEHLPKSQGVDLIHWLVYRCRQLVVAFPTEYVQGAWDGHPHEAHVSVWDEGDFRQFRHTYERRQFMNLAIVQGYQK